MISPSDGDITAAAGDPALASFCPTTNLRAAMVDKEAAPPYESTPVELRDTKTMLWWWMAYMNASSDPQKVLHELGLQEPVEQRRVVGCFSSKVITVPLSRARLSEKTRVIISTAVPEVTFFNLAKVQTMMTCNEERAKRFATMTPAAYIDSLE